MGWSCHPDWSPRWKKRSHRAVCERWSTPSIRQQRSLRFWVERAEEQQLGAPSGNASCLSAQQEVDE